MPAPTDDANGTTHGDARGPTQIVHSHDTTEAAAADVGTPPPVDPTSAGSRPGWVRLGAQAAATATARLDGRARSIAQALTAGVLGALPVLLVLGATPGRRPTVLIEWMFRGFTACALDGGALNPLVMTCARAGVPLGMHQLDGGVSYPLGGLFVRAGVDPLTAWKLAVALLLVVGFGALFWLSRRLTGSPAVAAVMVAAFGLNGTLTARTWNWYWNAVAIALLPVLFALLYALCVRAAAVRDGQRPPLDLAAPAVGTAAATIAIGVEWQYAGLFAAATAAVAVLVIAAQLGWTTRARIALLAGAASTVALVALVLRWRMATAGVTTQSRDFVTNARNEGVDLAALVMPDAHASMLGAALDAVGAHALVADRLTAGRMLWIAPYVGVALLVAVGVAFARSRRHGDRWSGTALAGDEGRRAFLVLLAIVAVGSLVLSMGPEWRLAGEALPDARVTSPLAWLWTATPLRWVRYPWTWNALTHLALVLGLGAAASTALRRHGRWSPLTALVCTLVVVELVSPQALASMGDTAPSVPDAPSRLTTADPEIVAFEADELAELRWAMAGAGGPVTLLPWANTWVVPHLGPAVGVEMRNAGIDRNLAQVEAAAPEPRPRIRRQRGDVIDDLFKAGWTEAVVLVDYLPVAQDIARHASGDLLESDRALIERNARTVDEADRRGYCTERHSWFTVITNCYN